MSFYEESKIIPNGTLVRIAWEDEFDDVFNNYGTFTVFEIVESVGSYMHCTIIYNLSTIKKWCSTPEHDYEADYHISESEGIGEIRLGSRPLLVVDTFLGYKIESETTSRPVRWYRVLKKSKLMWVAS